MLRRHRPVIQTVIFLGLLGALGYTVFLYNTLTLKLERSDRQIRKYTKHQQSLSAQLQVVYEHRARLEKTFEKEKADHKKTKADLENAKREFLVNFTRTKHETRNRFNSLETQHRMVKAQQEQLQVEYSRIQQQHARLVSEHQHTHLQQVKSFRDLKEQKNNEITALEEQIATLKKQGALLRQEAAEATYYRDQQRLSLQEINRYKSTVASLNQRLRQYQNILQKYQAKDISKGQETLHITPDIRPRASQPVPFATTSPPQGAQSKDSQTQDTKKEEQRKEEEEEDTENEEEQDKQRVKVQAPQQGRAKNSDTGYSRGRYQPAQRQQARLPEAQSREQKSQENFLWGPGTKTQRVIRQVTPKPLPRTSTVSKSDESEGESKADADDEQQAEEEKVKQYLSQNLANKMQQTVNQEMVHRVAPKQPNVHSIITSSPSSPVQKPPNRVNEQAEKPLQPAHKTKDSRLDTIPHLPQQPLSREKLVNPKFLPSKVKLNQKGQESETEKHLKSADEAKESRSDTMPRPPEQPLSREKLVHPKFVPPKVKLNQRGQDTEAEKLLKPADESKGSRSDTMPRPPDGSLSRRNIGIPKISPSKEKLTQLHPNMGQVRPPPKQSIDAENEERDDKEKKTEEEDADVDEEADVVEQKSNRLVKREVGNERDEKVEQNPAGMKPSGDVVKGKSLESKVKDALEEAVPQEGDEGRLHRRPIPKPVKRKQSEEDSENIEPGEAKSNDQDQAQDEDNEEGDEDPDQTKDADGKPDRPDGQQSDKANPKARPPAQDKSQQDQDENGNEDDGEEDAENELNRPGKQNARIRGLR